MLPHTGVIPSVDSGRVRRAAAWDPPFAMLGTSNQEDHMTIEDSLETADVELGWSGTQTAKQASGM